MRLHSALVAAACMAMGAAAASAQAGAVRGRVIETGTGEARQGASVTVMGTARGALTDSGGRYMITGLPAGSLRLRARMIGLRPEERTVQVRAGDTVDVSFSLESVPFTLETIRAEAHAAERERFERRPNVGTVRLTPSALGAIPQVGERDVLRAVQLLPGVLARNDFSAGFNVRGGEADQNLILLDGYPVYNPFHLGGLFSTFLEPTVGEVQLYTGAFSAAHGGRLSSVLDVTSARETRPGVHGTAGVSLLASSLSLGGAVGEHGSWMVAARRTYADKLADLIREGSLPYHFYDTQAHVTWRLPWKVDAAATAYHGADVLDGDFAAIVDTTEPGGGSFVFDWGNLVLGTTLRRMFVRGAGDSVLVEQRVSSTRFTTTLDLGAGTLLLGNRVRETRLAGGATWWRRGRERRAGYEWSAHRVRYDATSPQLGTPLFTLAQQPSSTALYYTEMWRPAEHWLMEAGVRGETITGAGWGAVSPRISARRFIGDDLAISFAIGQHAQWLHSLAREDIPVRIFDFWVTSDRTTAVSRAWHFVTGVERWLSGTRFVRLEGYYKHYGRLLEQNQMDDPAVRGDEFHLVRGGSYGLDLLARQIETGNWGGWLSYTYGVSTRESGGVRYWPGHDRRHNLNLVTSYSGLRAWLFSARLGLATGTPYTDIVGQLVRHRYNPATGQWDTGILSRDLDPVGGQRNAQRLPLFQRLDLGVARVARWRGMRIEPYISVVNAYNARNVFTYTFDYTSNPPTRTSVSQFPVLPSVGVMVEF